MKKTILLVDDEIDILDIQNRYLLQAGYDVLVAHDGKEGLELLRKKSIDVILTDIMMPNMDGYDFISEVQYIAPDQPFLQHLHPSPSACCGRQKAYKCSCYWPPKHCRAK